VKRVDVEEIPAGQILGARARVVQLDVFRTSADSTLLYMTSLITIAARAGSAPASAATSAKRANARIIGPLPQLDRSWAHGGYGAFGPEDRNPHVPGPQALPRADQVVEPEPAGRVRPRVVELCGTPVLGNADRPAEPDRDEAPRGRR